MDKTCEFCSEYGKCGAVVAIGNEIRKRKHFNVETVQRINEVLAVHCENCKSVN